jgi:hypothetical protein
VTDARDVPRDQVDAALHAASEEHGLETWYRDCVRPLLYQPEEQWPGCCGSNCEPCAQLLVTVARRTLEKLGL